MRIVSIKQINRDTPEGRLLWAALVELTTKLHTDKTPEGVIELLNEIADNNETNDEEKTVPEFDESVKKIIETGHKAD